jgi:oligopeptidase B
VPVTRTLHGDTTVDEFAWLAERDAPDVLAYLRAENAYTDQVFQPLAPLVARIAGEIRARTPEDDSSPPVFDRGYYYYTHIAGGQQYPVHCRKKGSLDATEEVLLDLNRMAGGHGYVTIAEEEVSDDGRLLAYTFDHVGNHEDTLAVRDLSSGRDLGDQAERVDYVAFSHDGRTLFYVMEDAVSKRGYRLYRHTIGQPQASDALVYEEPDERFGLRLERARSGAYLMLEISSHTTSEWRVLRADDPLGAWRTIVPRRQDHQYSVAHGGDRFYIVTNDRGRNGRVVMAPVADPSPAHWRELIAMRDDALIEGIDVMRTFLVVHEWSHALPHLRVLNLSRPGAAPREIPADEPLYDMRPDDNRDYDAARYRYRYESPLTPTTLYEYDVSDGRRTVLKREAVRGGYDPSRYRMERTFASAPDGVTVPISVVYARAAARPGPLLLTGYGSYGKAYRLTFDERLPSLLDRGIAFAVAHVRGGGDLGKPWHDQGRMMNKKNTFTDFIACAEDLIASGRTTSARLAITGRSAGGLLIGAVANMRPDLFHAVVAKVPFVDVLDTMLDPRLPLTIGEFEEWGDPRDAQAYAYIKSYSPYDNVARGHYPDMLVVSSYHDSQVMYFEPAKWVARLRARAPGNKLLLRMEMGPGSHGGKAGRYDRIADRAFETAFIAAELGAAN